MSIYTFSKPYLTSIIAHAAGLELEADALTLSGSTYTLTLNAPFDDEQFTHLQTFTDITRLL